MLTIIENGSKAWVVVAVQDELRIYNREDEGEWNELPLADESEQVDPEKSFMLEELYGQRVGNEGDDEEEEEGEDYPDEEAEGDSDDEDEGEEEPELQGDDSEEDEEPEEEEEKPSRRRAPAKRGRATAGRK